MKEKNVQWKTQQQTSEEENCMIRVLCRHVYNLNT